MKISTFFAQISLLAIAIVATVALCEGVYSLIYGQSLLRIPFGVQTTYLAVQTDAERAAAASLTEGPLAISWDPLVGYLMKPNHTHKFITELATADEFGQRRRVEPPATKGAAKIVILGDSVAFGYGVKDDETYASSLETHLAATMRDEWLRPAARRLLELRCNRRRQRLGLQRDDHGLRRPVLSQSGSATEIHQHVQRNFQCDSHRHLGSRYRHQCGQAATRPHPQAEGTPQPATQARHTGDQRRHRPAP